MKKIMIIIIFTLTVFSITANLRAPYYRDGSVSSNLKIKNSYKNIYLIKETMNITAYKTENDFTNYGNVKMDINYYIENTGSSEITVPVDFLGIGVKDYEIQNNGNKLIIKTGKDFESKKKLLKIMYKHRKNWNTKYYWIPDIKYEEEFKSIFSSEENLENFTYNFFDKNKINFEIISSELKLKPGINIININYNQTTFINEIHPVYKGFNYNRALIGFDYLLYPALSWQISKDFIFKIKITIPDLKRFTTYCRTNLVLLRYYDKKNKISVFKGEFKNFPEYIFTFLMDWKRK